MKILTVLGARPQFIKAATLSREISLHKSLQEIIVHTGQHYDTNMSEVFFEQMKIPKPNFKLNIKEKTHSAMTALMMIEIEKIALEQKPDFILVYGDTNSTLAGALVASKLHINLAHIEAGLRSFNTKMPEEINRILTDRVSKLLFCPTDTAVLNLQNEGFKSFDCKIINSGDIMYEGAMYYEKFAKKPSFDLKDDFLLCTVHRAENTDNLQRLDEIFSSLDEIASKAQIILPLHPRTKNALNLLGKKFNNIKYVEPLSYFEMLWLLKHSKMVLTDSGGLQKEAYFFKKPCIVLRDESEYKELQEHKFNVVSFAKKQNILSLYESFKFNQNYEMNLYGDANTSKIIVNELKNA